MSVRGPSAECDGNIAVKFSSRNLRTFDIELKSRKLYCISLLTSPKKVRCVIVRNFNLNAISRHSDEGQLLGDWRLSNSSSHLQPLNAYIALVDVLSKGTREKEALLIWWPCSGAAASFASR